VDGDEEVVAAVVEEVVVGDCAGGEQAGDFAFDGAFGFSGVTDLFANCDGFADFEQFGEVLFDGVVGNACHWDGFACCCAACGEGDVEQRGGFFGVVHEQFVEIPHAVKQEDVGVLRFDSEILLHHGGVLLFFAHGSLGLRNQAGEFSSNRRGA